MDAPPAPVVELEEMLMALKWDGPATGFFRMEVIALDCSPILLCHRLKGGCTTGC